MAENSKIEWCHHTANLWHGCTEVHEGCDNCYARVLSHRWGRELWGNDVPRLEIKSVWHDLEKYQKLAAAAGEMHRVFVGSMMDIFEKPMPVINSKGGAVMDHGEWMKTEKLRSVLFHNISAGIYPNLMFLLLTKRPSNINKYIPEAWKTNPPANVMFGTSPVNQETAYTLINQLVKVNGKRFLSVEPLLGSVNLVHWLAQIDWVIVGGESGHGARPMHPDWARSLRDQCTAAGVSFLFKQWGEYYPNALTDGTKPSVYVDSKTLMARVGKKKAGRLLDGIEHNGYPNHSYHAIKSMGLGNKIRKNRLKHCVPNSTQSSMRLL